MTTYAIERTRIIGTDCYTYTGWEPDDEQHQHSAITHIEGQRYGAISSRRLPKILATLPAGPERIEQVRAFYDQLCLREYQLICATFAEVIGACPSPTGTVELQRDPTLPALPSEVRFCIEMGPAPLGIGEIYRHLATQADADAIANTSTAALASDIADLIGSQPLAGYPTDEDGAIDLYAIAHQVQQMATEEATR